MTIGTGLKAILGIIAILAVVGATFWWRAAGDTPEVSAQEVVKTACNDAEMLKYYDESTVLTETAKGDPSDTGTQYIDLSVAGSDFHVIFSGKNSTSTFEHLRADGVVYERRSEPGSVWKVTDLKLGDPRSQYYGENYLCPDVSLFREVGTEQLGGKTVRRFTDKPEGPQGLKIDDSFSGFEEWRTRDFLVDNEGQLLKIEQYVERAFRSEEYDLAYIITVETIISGHGELNVIEAPAVGGS